MNLFLKYRELIKSIQFSFLPYEIRQELIDVLIYYRDLSIISKYNKEN